MIHTKKAFKLACMLTGLQAFLSGHWTVCEMLHLDHLFHCRCRSRKIVSYMHCCVKKSRQHDACGIKPERPYLNVDLGPLCLHHHIRLRNPASVDCVDGEEQ